MTEPITTASGIPLPPVVTPEHVAPDVERRLGGPGTAPYTRGIHAGMYRDRPWTVRQLAGFGSATDTNARYRLLLDKGATGINAVFDYPSLRAFDSDHPLAVPDVGRGGVAVDVTEDFDDLFAGIDLETVSVSLVSSQPIGAAPHLAMYLKAADKRKLNWDQLRGTSQNDFLMETCITIAPQALPPAASFRVACDVAEFCVQHLPRWNPISVAGYNYREAGADAVLELALTLAHGRAVVDELNRRGVPVSEAAGRVTFFLNAHNDLFEEIAKFRAARRMWYRIVHDELGCSDERAAKFKFHVQTSGMTCTAEQPLVNVARSALQAFAAICGGAQSMHVNGYDEAVSIPSEHAATVALRTQQVLQYESGIARSADPFGGSYLIEYLTDQMEAQVLDLMGDITAQGGIVAATESGWVHKEIGARAYEQMRGVTDGSYPVVGVNVGRDEEAPSVTPFTLPADTVERQKSRLDETRRSRDQNRYADAISRIVEDFKADVNVMPAVLAAVDAGATVGEIGQALRDVAGPWEFPLW